MSIKYTEHAILEAVKSILEFKSMGLSSVPGFENKSLYGVKGLKNKNTDTSHNSQFRYEAINFEFSRELDKKLSSSEINAWSDHVTGLFGKVHHSAFINSKEFELMFSELMRHTGVPAFDKGNRVPYKDSVADKALQALRSIKDGEPEDAAGYNKKLGEIAKTTRTGKGKKSNPFNGVEPKGRENPKPKVKKLKIEEIEKDVIDTPEDRESKLYRKLRQAQSDGNDEEIETLGNEFSKASVEADKSKK